MSLKQDVINAILKLPEDVNIDEIMYRLYVISKVNEGRNAIKNNESVNIEELKKEIETW